MKAVLTDERFPDPDWIYERKLDGIRCVAIRDGGAVRLLSRNDLTLNGRFPGIATALERQPCKRFAIDLTARTKHGALLDAELTAQVYLELVGGRQRKLSLDPVAAAPSRVDEIRVARIRIVPLAPRISAEELAAHAAFVADQAFEAEHHRLAFT